MARAPPRARGQRRAGACSCSSRQRLGALEDLARARVGVAHLGLLLVGQREDVQGQQLVDLAAVEQVAGALGRDPRVVLEDDRRGEQRAAVVGSTTAPATCPRCGSPARPRSASGGSVSETKRPPPRAARRASSRTSAAAPPRGRRPPTASCWRSGRVTRDEPAGDGSPATSTDPARPSHARVIRPASRPSPSRRSSCSRRADRHGDATPRPGRSDRGPVATSRSTASSQARWRSPADGQLVDGLRTAARRARTVRRTTCRKRTARRSTSRAVAVARAGTACASSTGRPDARPLCAARVDAAERPAPLVLQRRAPVGPQHVALVEDRVGDRRTASTAQRSSASPSSASSASLPGGQRVARTCRRAGGRSCRARSRSHAVPREVARPSSPATRAPAAGTRPRCSQEMRTVCSAPSGAGVEDACR